MIASENIILNTGWEAICYAIPCILLTIAATFRLDGLFAGPARKAGKPKSISGCDARGRPDLKDPGGRPSNW